MESWISAQEEVIISAWVMPSETITRSLMMFWSHFGNVHHNDVVYICQLVPRVKYVLNCHMCVVHHSKYARRGYVVWLV
jgi:hypothetical protein